MGFINLIGLVLEIQVFSDKYEINFSQQQIQATAKRLINQLWKLIPMRENNEDWKKQLNTVLIEIVGLNEIFISPLFLSLISKLEGLQVLEINFEQYRKTIFECISLLQELTHVRV